MHFVGTDQSETLNGTIERERPRAERGAGAAKVGTLPRIPDSLPQRARWGEGPDGPVLPSGAR